MKLFAFGPVIAVALLLSSGAFAADASQSAGLPIDPEIAAAQANRALVKVRPEMKVSPTPEFPESERALGHHGLVKLWGILGVDGRLRHVRVTRSSGAPVLDEAAVKATEASVFSPAKAADGVPIAIPIVTHQEFYSYKSTDPGGGMVKYGCRQFTLDTDWWRATFPQAKAGDQELYTMMLGLGTLVSLNAGKLDAKTLKQALSDFALRWDAALATCRAHPDRRLVDVLQPEGRYAEALARQVKGGSR